MCKEITTETFGNFSLWVASIDFVLSCSIRSPSIISSFGFICRQIRKKKCSHFSLIYLMKTNNHKKRKRILFLRLQLNCAFHFLSLSIPGSSSQNFMTISYTKKGGLIFLHFSILTLILIENLPENFVLLIRTRVFCPISSLFLNNITNA